MHIYCIYEPEIMRRWFWGMLEHSYLVPTGECCKELFITVRLMFFSKALMSVSSQSAN